MVDSQLFAWMSILVLYIRSGHPDLTNMQIAVLLIVYMTPGPHSARDLALQLKVTRSTMSRVLGRLASLGYLQQDRDANERRKAIIGHTDGGQAFLEGLKQTIAGHGPVAPS